MNKIHEIMNEGTKIKQQLEWSVCIYPINSFDMTEGAECVKFG